MEGYCVDYDWANEMNNATYILSDMIKKDASFEDIWEKTRKEITRINKKQSYGNIRNGDVQFIYINNGMGRGQEYYEKYKNELKNRNGSYKPINTSEHKNSPLCKISGNYKIYIDYGSHCYYDYLNLKSNVEKEYKKLKNKQNPKDDDINRSIATIHWLIAQATPFTKGSDSFANLLTKSIYHAYNMKLTPAKEGVSFDFEAFYSTLDDYIKKYPKFFEKPPSRT